MRTLMMVPVVVLALYALEGAGSATGNRALIYGGAGQGKVVFDGRLHASKGLVCNDCHAALFATRKRAMISMDDHYQAAACFACHDGKKLFNDCDRCHRKI